MNKYIFFSKYGINHTRLNSFFSKFGFSRINKSFNDKNIEENLNKFLNLNLDKKEILLKKNHLIYLKDLENGSIAGYKKFRGLPSNNQRTKTNAKTNRIKK
jgi:ribosomal protein S13